MGKNKKKLKKIVKKIKNEAAKNALSALEVHAVSPPAFNKIESRKVKIKAKKSKGVSVDGKKEKAGKENKKEPSGIPRAIEAGRDKGGFNDPNWWPWERD
jgi:hypothetical protein